jgi:hypothetical protein
MAKDVFLSVAAPLRIHRLEKETGGVSQSVVCSQKNSLFAGWGMYVWQEFELAQRFLRERKHEVGPRTMTYVSKAVNHQ